MDRRITFLIVGLGLLIFSIMDLFMRLTELLPFPYNFFRFAFWSLLMGSGISMTVYALLGRRRLKWFALTAGLVYITFSIVSWSPFAGGLGLASYIALFLFTSIPFCLAFMMKKYWKILAVTPLIFLLFAGYWLGVQFTVWEESNPYDTPSRDEVYAVKGYSFCGEFYVEPTPGKHVISWNKTLRGNESIACYFKIILSKREKYIPATYTSKIEINRKIPSGLPITPFYTSSHTAYDEEGSRGAWTAFQFYEPENTIASHYLSGDPASIIPFYRLDILFSYKPVKQPEEYGLLTSTEVNWRVEINILGF